MKKIRRLVKVSVRVEGIHCWPECNDDRVGFLRSPHRHMFHITAYKRVDHNDRDVEIILLKREIKRAFGKEPVDFRNKSCEMIAEELINFYKLDSCEVLEDGENGCYLKVLD